MVENAVVENVGDLGARRLRLRRADSAWDKGLSKMAAEG